MPGQNVRKVRAACGVPASRQFGNLAKMNVFMPSGEELKQNGMGKATM